MRRYYWASIRASGWRAWLLAAAVLTIHFACFYWWAAGDYFFSGDGLFYFSRRITGFSEVWQRIVSLDELYQYRPLPYVFFSFVLYPLFGTNPSSYHLATYLMASINTLLSCGCLYYWARGDRGTTLVASVFLLLNPVNFFPSFGPTYIDVLLSGLFYNSALLLVLSGSTLALALAPVCAVLSLLSREVAIVLPFEALLILIAVGVPLRNAISRTRSLWFVLAGYALLQFTIRQGNMFAPAGANPNLQFVFSSDRLMELVRGIKPAIFYPENYHLSLLTHEIGRSVRLLFLVPWIVLLVWALLRRNRLALSGLVWIPISLLPVAFIRMPVAARHYYLAIPALALAFAIAVRNTRLMGIVVTVLGLVTVTNTAIYHQDSWVAAGSKLTKSYLDDIERTAAKNGLSEFYVLDSGDKSFYWHIDGGSPLKEFLGKDYWFSFASIQQPLSLDRLLGNQVSVVVPTAPGLRQVLKTGEFPKLRDSRLCSAARRLVRSEGACAVFFRGLEFQRGREREEPLFESAQGLVIRSRTTVFLSNMAGTEISGSAQVSPDSTDGVSFQLYTQIDGKFRPILNEEIEAGERIQVNKKIAPPEGDIVVLRIGPGPMNEETGDRLIWEGN